ncbi:MAG: ABC transporter ATP-binding protein [Roseiarcus sp.]
MSATGEPLLSLRGVKTYYGNVVALKGVDVDVNEGEIVTLIGANGAGKSTLMMTVFGNPHAREGRICFAGCDITALPTHEIAKLRIAQAPEGRRIFSRMTVMENLQIGATVTDAADFDQDLERVFALFPRLRDRSSQRGGTLSGGEQQMLAIGRALMLNPRLLLLDEPTEGLAPLIVDEVLAALRKLVREDGLSMIVVEQKAHRVLPFTDEAIILERGAIVHAGTSAALAADAAALEAHLTAARTGGGAAR